MPRDAHPLFTLGCVFLKKHLGRLSLLNALLFIPGAHSNIHDINLLATNFSNQYAFQTFTILVNNASDIAQDLGTKSTWVSTQYFRSVDFLEMAIDVSRIEASTSHGCLCHTVCAGPCQCEWQTPRVHR